MVTTRWRVKTPTKTLEFTKTQDLRRCLKALAGQGVSFSLECSEGGEWTSVATQRQGMPLARFKRVQGHGWDRVARSCECGWRAPKHLTFFSASQQHREHKAKEDSGP